MISWQEANYEFLRDVAKAAGELCDRIEEGGRFTKELLLEEVRWMEDLLADFKAEVAELAENVKASL